MSDTITNAGAISTDNPADSQTPAEIAADQAGTQAIEDAPVETVAPDREPEVDKLAAALIDTIDAVEAELAKIPHELVADAKRLVRHLRSLV